MTATLLRRLSRLLTVVTLLALAGCQSLAYYAQAARGQTALLVKRQPIERVLARPDTGPELRRQLETVQRIRAFAAAELGLPARRQYGSYVELERDFPLWSVTATPALSLTPRDWCYWLVGCLSYRGFFRETRAVHYARALELEGNDVYVGGVPAYSTLGWFRDPVLSSFVRLPEPELAELIFHELTHQVLFVPGDTEFNESLAMTVAAEGLRRYSERYALDLAPLQQAKLREREFVALVLDYRERLAAVFAAARSDAERRHGKAEVYAALQAAYAQLKQRWNGYDGYDGWFATLNNAKLNSVATYYGLVPQLQALLRAQQGDMARFLAACRELARLDVASRHRRLAELLTQARP
jgi:predicted aminopeptidase